jgi:hypothetical protein
VGFIAPACPRVDLEGPRQDSPIGHRP